MHCRTFNVLLWFCYGLLRGEIVRFIFICNWHILWQNGIYLFIIYHCFPYSAHNMFVKSFQERQVWSQSKQLILIRAMVSQDWLFLDRLVYLNMGSFIVFRLLLYWAYFCTWGFVMDWQKGRLLGSCVWYCQTMSNYVSFIEFWCVVKL